MSPVFGDGAMVFGSDEIAQVCHEANRALQVVAPRQGVPTSASWEDVSGEMRRSGIHGVQLARAGATPEQLHEEWCAFKRAEGWTFGLTKDEEAKTHPCLLPYADLSPVDRAKDRLFLAIVQALAEPIIE